jgi:hypothetical protein
VVLAGVLVLLLLLQAAVSTLTAMSDVAAR